MKDVKPDFDVKQQVVNVGTLVQKRSTVFAEKEKKTLSLSSIKKPKKLAR